MTTELALRILLRALGVIVLCAVPAIFMPTAWMAAIHEWLGLGAMPEGPLVEYLTRSLSAMYAIQGPLFLLVASDLRRYRGVVTYLGAVNVALGLAMVWVDHLAGMPAFWSWGEGPPTVVIGAAILWLVRSVPRPGEDRG